MSQTQIYLAIPCYTAPELAAEVAGRVRPACIRIDGLGGPTPEALARFGALRQALAGVECPVLVAVAGPDAAQQWAKACHADGWHLTGQGREIGPLRSALGGQAILGATVDGRDDAMTAGEDGADYLSFAALPGDGSAEGLELAAWWAALFEVPCVVEGATAETAAAFTATGAEFVAPDLSLWAGPDPAGQIAALLEALQAA